MRGRLLLALRSAPLAGDSCSDTSLISSRSVPVSGSRPSRALAGVLHPERAPDASEGALGLHRHGGAQERAQRRGRCGVIRRRAAASERASRLPPPGTRLPNITIADWCFDHRAAQRS